MIPQSQHNPALAGQAEHTPSLIAFVAEIDRLIDAQKPSTHLWNYCVWNRKAVLRAAIRHDMSVRKVLAHHELMPGRVAANTEVLLSDLQACNSHAALVAALEGMLAVHASYCDLHAPSLSLSKRETLNAQARSALASAKESRT